MERMAAYLLIFTFLLCLFSNFRLYNAWGSRTIFVPTDFPTIQAAINNATDNDIIFVFNGTYYERLVVNKSITIVGQNKNLTIVDGEGAGTVIRVIAENVYIANFTVRNGGFLNSTSGVYVNSNNVSLNEIKVSDNAFGFYFENSRNCFVRKCDIFFNHIGIYMEKSEDTIVEFNNVSRNVDRGIEIDDSFDIELKNNSVMDNGLKGIYILNSRGNIVSGNIVARQESGITLNMSGNNMLRNNIIGSNQYNFRVHGNSLSDFLQDVDASNTVDDKPVYYLVNRRDFMVNASSNAGYIAIVNCSGISVEGLDLKSNGEGVLLAYSHDCRVGKSNVTGNFHGVFLHYSQDCEVYDMSIAGNGRGLTLVHSQGSLVSGNLIVENDGYGVKVEFSHDCVISGNNISRNREHGFYIYGSVNCSINDNIVFANGAGVRIQFSDRSAVEGNLIANNKWDGVYMVGSSDCMVKNNEVSENVGCGIRFMYSAFNFVSENTLTDNQESGVYIYKGNNVSIDNNIITDNVVGVFLEKSFNCEIAFNHISDHSREGIKVAKCGEISAYENTVFGNSRAGLGLFYSNNSIVKSNDISKNMEHGIWLDNAISCVVEDNNVTGNGWSGIYLHVSSNNKIFHNNFSNNTQQVEVSEGWGNLWDDGYPGAGNYWSDYAGVDLYNGPFQDLPGSDGVGDSPYIIDNENLDRYPLMKPHRTHDVRVLDVCMISNKVYAGWLVEVNVTIENAGDYIESCELSVFCDSMCFGKTSIETLHVGETFKVSYIWNTSGVVPCRNYTLKVEVGAVEGEADLENNVFVTSVKVNFLGDLNGDGTVNILDIAQIARAFGSGKGDARYRLDCDLNMDNVINIVDVASAARNFGEGC